jgi:hypothetical protein
MLEELVVAVFGALRSRARPTLTGLGLGLAAAMLCLLAGLYLSYAVFLALEEQLGPPLAGALTGALLLLLAGVLLLWAILLNRKPPRRDTDEADIAEALARLGGVIGHKIGAPNASVAITAVLAGLVVGISPSARGFLLNLADQLFKENTGEPK